MNFRDHGCNHQPSCLVDFFISRIGVGDDLVGPGGIAKAGIPIRCLLLKRSEVINKAVVFANENVVIEAQADVPVVGKRCRFLPLPLRLHTAIGFAFIDEWQVTVGLFQFGPIGRIADHSLG